MAKLNTVWGFETNMSREQLFLRKSIMDGFKFKGNPFLFRQVKRLIDKEEHCPRCYDPILKQSKDSRCPMCSGTGFNEGYHEPFLTWGSLAVNNTALDLNVDKPGVAERQDLEIQLGCEPIYSPGDIFAEVRKMVKGKPVELGRIYRLSKPIRIKLLNGMVSDNNGDDRDMMYEDMIVAQSAPVKLLLPTDERYMHTEDFWQPFEIKSVLPYFPKREEPEQVVDPTEISTIWSPE